MHDPADLTRTIRKMVDHINSYVTPLFQEEYTQRNERRPLDRLGPDDELRRIAIVFAYSGGVQATPVTRMIKAGDYDYAFANFNVDAVRQMNPCDIYDQYWPRIKPIKNENKLLWLVRAARVLANGHSILKFLIMSDVPASVRSSTDIERFWSGLKKVSKALKKAHLSGMQSVTSQLHFLMGLGYDCVKPDRIVMDVAQTLGMVNSERNEKDFILVTRLLQNCAIELGIRPAILDMYFLIQGRHTDARAWTREDFTPWQGELKQELKLEVISSTS
jgi:hypothetical protein